MYDVTDHFRSADDLVHFIYESPRIKWWLMSEFLNLSKLQLKILSSYINNIIILIVIRRLPS